MTVCLTQLFLATVLAPVFLLFNRIARKRASAFGRYLCGWILAVIFLIPIRLPVIKVELSERSVQEVPMSFFSEENVSGDFLWEGALSEVGEAEYETKTDAQKPTKSVSPWEIAVFLYILGVLVMFCRVVFRYCRTVSIMRRCGRAPTEQEYGEFREICLANDISRMPRLLICPDTELMSPLMFGIFRQTVLVSEALPKEEYAMILGHELTHCRRRDPVWKLFLSLLRCAYWFHPLMWLFVRTMNELCEESCDERFLAEKSFEEKRQYCRLLVLTAADRNVKNSLIFTAFKGGKTQMKKRLHNILSEKNRKITLMFISVMLVIALLSVTIYAVVAPDTDAPEKTPSADETAGETTAVEIKYYSEEELLEQYNKMVENHRAWFGIDDFASYEEVRGSGFEALTDGFLRKGTYNGHTVWLTPEGEVVTLIALDGVHAYGNFDVALKDVGIAINYVSGGDGTGTVEYWSDQKLLDELMYTRCMGMVYGPYETYVTEGEIDYQAFYDCLKYYYEENQQNDTYGFYQNNLELFKALLCRSGIEIIE